jgi:hypothetical protein
MYPILTTEGAAVNPAHAFKITFDPPPAQVAHLYYGDGSSCTIANHVPGVMTQLRAMVESWCHVDGWYFNVQRADYAVFREDNEGVRTLRFLRDGQLLWWIPEPIASRVYNSFVKMTG